MKLPNDIMEKFRKAGSKGGKLRAKTLTPERRSEISRKGAEARWGKKAS